MTVTKRTRNNLLAAAIVLAWLIAVLILGGCAGLMGGQGLQLTYQDESGKLVELETDYQIENGFTMERDGEGYKIELGSASTLEPDQAGMFSLMAQLLAMIQQAYIPAPAPPPAD